MYPLTGIRVAKVILFFQFQNKVKLISIVSQLCLQRFAGSVLFLECLEVFPEWKRSRQIIDRSPLIHLDVLFIDVIQIPRARFGYIMEEAEADDFVWIDIAGRSCQGVTDNRHPKGMVCNRFMPRSKELKA